MATKGMVDARDLVYNRDNLSKKVRRMALAVPAIALLIGIIIIALEPRYGLMVAAFIIGWTQLVGL